MKIIPMLVLAGSFALSAVSAWAQTNADQLNAQVLERIRAANTVAVTPAAPASTNVNLLQGVRVGAYVGHDFREQTDFVAGAVISKSFTPNLAAEVSYDYLSQDQDLSGQMVMGNLVYSRGLGIPGVVPYVLAGAGVGWNTLGKLPGGDNLMLYNLGGGVKFNLTRNWDLDVRYRYVGAFEDNTLGNRHMTTLGVGYRF